MAKVKAVSDMEKFREVFLKSFVRGLIDQSYVPPQPKEIPEEKVEKPKKKVTIEEREEEMQKSIMPKRPMKRLPTRMPMQKGKPAMQLPPLPPVQNVPVGGEGINLGKLTSILKDPAVMSVECPGPGRNLLVNKGGMLQTTPVMLTKEEIDTLMQDISNKTRIPLIPSGLFRAAFQNLLVTSVISEFVGTRFIVRKRTPFEGQLPMPGMQPGAPPQGMPPGQGLPPGVKPLPKLR